MKPLGRLSAVALLLVFRVFAVGQCGAPITTFPYNEGFEVNGAWTPGGNQSDWTWGTPAHPLINSAGGGQKSWCVGGLTGTFYNAGEFSWLESPCFDFSALARPWIGFKIFWECERQYDGLTFQYSLDGGTTYQNVGAYGDPEDCLTSNWFNSGNITNLQGVNPKHGWSGRVGPDAGSCLGGSGSSEWITASHCLVFLAGEPSVRFRFVFGAGTTCNSFDGVAIDDVVIQEPAAPAADFGFSCSGNTVSFSNASGGCPSTFAWDFGDPGSGVLNYSSSENPSHDYASPGTYDVTLTILGPCQPSVTITQTITVIEVNVNVTDALCGGNTGSAASMVIGGVGPFTYDWQPGGQTTASISNLGAGDYTLTVSAPNACSSSVNFTITEPANALAGSVTITQPTCNGGSDGAATMNVSGGAGGYTFDWSPLGGNAATASGLTAGNYTVTVTDANGCELVQSVVVLQPALVVVTTDGPVNICAGATITLEADATGGTPGYTFGWSGGTAVVTPVMSTTYQVIATDANGCTSWPMTLQVNVGAAIDPVITANDPSGCAPLCVQLSATPAGMTDYTWNFSDGSSANGQAPLVCFNDAGTIDAALTVTDANGCAGSTSNAALINVWPVPSAAFTANPPITTIDHPVVQFVPSNAGATSWAWDFGTGEPSSESIVAFAFPAVGCYPVQLEVQNDQGCSSSSSIEVCIENTFSLYLPNAFTPNGDGINDEFLPITSVRSPKQFELLVFDRWGALMWSTGDIHQGWNGDQAKDGVYAWKLAILDSTGESHKMSGHVVVLR